MVPRTGLHCLLLTALLIAVVSVVAMMPLMSVVFATLMVTVMLPHGGLVGFRLFPIGVSGIRAETKNSQRHNQR